MPKWSNIKNRCKKIHVPSHPMPVVLRVLCSIVLAVIFAGAFCWLILNSQFKDDPEALSVFVAEKPLVCCYTYIFVLLITLLMMAIFWRPCFGIGLTFVIISIMLYANEQKMAVRAAPLTAADFLLVGQAGELMSFVDENEIFNMVAGVCCLLVGAWLFDRILRRGISKNPTECNWWERHAILPRVAFTLLTLATINVLYKPILHHGGTPTEDVEWLDTTFTAWNPEATYENNGFLLALLYDFGSSSLDEPEGYSEERIQAIYDKYNKIKKQDESRVALSDKVDNLVFILDESFYDPATLNDFYAHLGGDVTPNLHNKIFRKYPSGYMYSPEYGGGTANVEYAALTGMSNFWANTTPYSNFVMKLDYMPGVVSYAKSNGFEATAIHAFPGSMYRRDMVYDRMGFDEFRDNKKMTHTALENGRGYISDAEVYAEIYDVITESDGPHMVGAATMQNHSPYESASYPELNFPLVNKVDSWYGIESSFESLSHGDQYLMDFLEKLDTLDEKTVVLWFGDHLAGAFDRQATTDELGDKNSLHFTPYFIYANFDLDELYTVAETAEMNAEAGFEFETRGVDLPTVTPNCMANMVYNTLGVEKPVINYLLDEVCEENPVLAPAYYTDETNPVETEALKDYELINYDLSHGERYWLKNDLD